MRNPRASGVRRGATVRVPTETELKLRITPEAAAKLARHPVIKTLKRGPARKARLLSTYYDTDDGALAAAGIALRVRRDGRHWMQTIKGPADASSAGGSVRTSVPGASVLRTGALVCAKESLSDKPPMRTTPNNGRSFFIALTAYLLT